jgi:GntR family transcriptional regulator of arabinose operon
LIPVLPDEFSRRLLKGVTEGLSERGLAPVLGLTAPDSASESRAIRRLRRLGIDGLIVCPMEGELYNEEILRIKLDRFPFVLLDRRLNGIDTPYVVGDGGGLVKVAVQHLAGLGHRHIALLATTPKAERTQSLAARIAGFEEAMAAHVSAKPAVWTVHEDEQKNRAPLDLVLGHLARMPEVTAVIGITTRDTLLVRSAARALKLRIPEDLSIVGFDYSGVVDAEVGGFAEGEGLTWLDQSEEQMGRKAAELIAAVVEDPESSPHAVIPGVFHQGGTTASPRDVSALIGEMR